MLTSYCGPDEASQKKMWSQALPNATLTVLDKCGHLPPIERPDQFARLVVDFLGR